MEKYPFLIYQICSGADLTMINHMLNELCKIEKGHKTQEQVDVEMGKMLAEKYVTPDITNIDKNNK